MSKRSITDFALWGGTPEFAQPLHVGRPNVGNPSRFLERVNQMFDRRYFTNNGPLVQEFEHQVASYVGVKHCIAMCNATVALEVAIRALGLKGEVIVPSFTFIATPHSLTWQHVTPVFADIDLGTHNLDPKEVERLITPRTTGILAVHVWGRACEVGLLAEIADRHNLRLIFDAAHAFACSHGGKMMGGFGDLEVFSFHATKFFNTFEGGAVVTNDDDLASTIRLMRNFGFAGYDDVTSIGTNGKMTEICAAMGLTSFETLDQVIAVNRENYELYHCELDDIRGLELITYPHEEKNNYHYIVLEVDPLLAGISRDQLVRVLKAENVLARRYFYPGCHQMEPYRSLPATANSPLPNTETMVQRVVSLPNGTAVSSSEIGALCAMIRWLVAHPDQVQSAFTPESRIPVDVQPSSH